MPHGIRTPTLSYETSKGGVRDSELNCLNKFHVNCRPYITLAFLPLTYTTSLCAPQAEIRAFLEKHKVHPSRKDLEFCPNVYRMMTWLASMPKDGPGRVLRLAIRNNRFV